MNNDFKERTAKNNDLLQLHTVPLQRRDGGTRPLYNHPGPQNFKFKILIISSEVKRMMVVVAVQ